MTHLLECGACFSIEKIPNPASINDTRSISKSPFQCTLKKIVVKWHLFLIEPQIDWGQYGGMRGCSISHLMVELLTFVHFNVDIRSRQGITLTAIDYSKAFNCQNHKNFLTILHNMNVPGWLLNIILGFLSNRAMTVI